MSWLNLNESLNSLKGQITNFATEVLSEGAVQDSGDGAAAAGSSVKDLEEKCQQQELEIATLKKLNDELQAALQSEKLTVRNGATGEDTSWYWDPPPQSQDQIKRKEVSDIEKKHDLDKDDDELNRLIEENKNLAKNLEDLDTQHQLAMEKILMLKKEIQKNFEDLKVEHEKLTSVNDNYVFKIESLTAEIEIKNKVIGRLTTEKEEYNTLQHKYMNLEKIHSLLKENAEKFQEENQNLHEEVFKLQEKVATLEHDTKQVEFSDTVLKETYDELMANYMQLKNKKNSKSCHLDELNIDDNAKSVIENLKSEIHELKQKVMQNEDEQIDTKFIKSERILQLYNKYINFDIPVDYTGEMPSASDNIALHKLESVFKIVNSFKQNIHALEQKLSEKNHTVSHLRTQIEDITGENDFLTADIQHYESEIKEMRKNNDFLINEITNLKNTSKLEPIIETHEDNLAKLESDLDSCTQLNKYFESQIAKIKQELCDVQAEKLNLQKSLNDLKEKYTSILTQFESFQSKTIAFHKMEQISNIAHDEDVNKARIEIEDLKKRLIVANTNNEQLSIDIHIIENDKVLLTKEVDDLKHALRDSTLYGDKLKIANESIEQQLKLAEDNLKTNVAEKQKLLQKISQLESQILLFNNSSLTKLDKSELHNNETMASELNNLRGLYEDVVKENTKLKNFDLDHQITSLNQIIEELKGKLIQQETLHTEIATLRNDKQNLTAIKLHLEAELSSTDSKIVSLEHEFDKLNKSIHDKDNIIYSLNSSLSQNKEDLENLKQNVSDLLNSIEIKNQEITRLNSLIQECKDSLENTTDTEKVKHQNITNEFEKKLQKLTTEMSMKDKEILTLTNNMESEKCNKEILENKNKEINVLNQTIAELTDKIKTADLHNDDVRSGVIQEKQTILKEVDNLKHKLTIKENEFVDIKLKLDELEKTCTEQKNTLESTTKEKTELINLVSLKHNESIQYHNEIQRLNHVLLEQANGFKKAIADKDALLLQNSSNECSTCENLKITLKEKNEIIVTLNQNLSDFDKVKAEYRNASDMINTLKERCENLDKSMAIQLDAVKRLTAENSQLSEKEQNSTRELERLRHHLLETEENYTRELMAAEEKLTECQARLSHVEERAKQTSTIYTSNSIRANQEVETLRTQIRLLEKQREEVQGKLSEAEDIRNRSDAALSNLQVVLEQFQLDKERDIKLATEKIHNKLEEQKRQNGVLKEEITRLKVKLEESLAGLQAASRLGDQLETKKALINDLKGQVSALQKSAAAAEARYHNAAANTQDRVDKHLVKNLVINYVAAASQNSVNRIEILRILSTVLDCNRQECERLGLARAPPPPPPPGSLAAEFVRFLQHESSPRAPLPNMMDITTSSRSTTPVSRNNSTIGQQSPFEASHRRVSSNGSNNVLFQHIDSVETSSRKSVETTEVSEFGTNDRSTLFIGPSFNPGVSSVGATISVVPNIGASNSFVPNIDGTNSVIAYRTTSSVVPNIGTTSSDGTTSVASSIVETTSVASNISSVVPSISTMSILPPNTTRLDTGVTQPRNTEGAILKYVLKDM